MSTARGLAALGRRFVETKSTTHSVVAADVGKTFLVTGTWTMPLPLVTVAQNGFSISLRNVGSGVIALDPAGSETVNGAATMGVYPGDSCELICDGSAWHAMFASSNPVVGIGQVPGSTTNVSLVLPAEFSTFSLRLKTWGVSSTAAIGARFSFDGGTTYYNTAGNYDWAQQYTSTTSGPARYVPSAAIFTSSAIELSPGLVAATPTQFSVFDIAIDPGGSGLVGGLSWTAAYSSVTSDGSGFVGTTGRVTNLQILTSGSGNNLQNGRYRLVGHRG